MAGVSSPERIVSEFGDDVVVFVTSGTRKTRNFAETLEQGGVSNAVIGADPEKMGIPESTDLTQEVVKQKIDAVMAALGLLKNSDLSQRYDQDTDTDSEEKKAVIQTLIAQGAHAIFAAHDVVPYFPENGRVDLEKDQPLLLLERQKKARLAQLQEKLDKLSMDEKIKNVHQSMEFLLGILSICLDEDQIAELSNIELNPKLQDTIISYIFFRERKAIEEEIEKLIAEEKARMTEIYVGDPETEVIAAYWFASVMFRHVALDFDGVQHYEDRVLSFLIKAEIPKLTQEQLNEFFKNKKMVFGVGPRIPLAELIEPEAVWAQQVGSDLSVDEKAWESISLDWVLNAIVSGVLPEDFFEFTLDQGMRFEEVENFDEVNGVDVNHVYAQNESGTPHYYH